VMPPLHVRMCHSSKSASRTHIALFAETMYFASTSATSSDIYGTGRLSRLFVVVCVFQAYPPLFVRVFSSEVFIIPTFTGGSGKKYSAYALARRLAIALKLGRKVAERARSGMCRSAGIRGKVQSASV
jgi:hypothetical protein